MKRSVMLLTLGLWAVVTSGYGYFYVCSRIGWPEAQGYEKLWDWQLMFFALVRLPFLLALLGVVLWFESRLVK